MINSLIFLFCSLPPTRAFSQITDLLEHFFKVILILLVGRNHKQICQYLSEHLTKVKVKLSVVKYITFFSEFCSGL